jgi:hypothetical protein
MPELESLLLSLVIPILNIVVKNPKLSTTVQAQIIGVATELLEGYGYTVTPPATPTPTPATKS